MFRKTLLPIFSLIGLAIFLLHATPTQAQAPSAYDLINSVNGWRISTGLAPLEIDNALMAAAQAHSEYQASIGSWSHVGAGGTYEWDRAAAAGYGGGAAIKCDEAVAIANVNTSVDTVVYTLWNDYDHRDLVLLNPSYVHVGAAAVEQGGLVYYTLDACYTGSGAANNPPANTGGSTTISGLPTATREIIIPVQTVAPADDGSITHEVQPGQSLWAISDTYKVDSALIVQLNNLASDNPVIFPGQKLLIRPSFTPSPSPTITETPIPATRTPRPTATPLPTRPTKTPTPTPTATDKPLLPEISAIKSLDRHTLGIAIIAVCGLGLAAVLIGLFKSK